MYTSCIIYIDVIKLVTLCRIKPRAKYGWKYRDYGYFKNIKMGYSSVKLFFIPKSGAEEGGFCLGNLYIEFSAPKFFEETNESGLPLEDLDTVYDNLIEVLDYYHILPPLDSEGWSQTSFEITKLESSITLYFNSQEEVDEHLRLFRMRYFPYHKPNMLNRKEQDYDTTVYHGTKSEDIVLYDKKKETEEHNSWDSDDTDDDFNNVYMLRLEFRRKKSTKKIEEDLQRDSFGTFADLAGENQYMLRRIRRFRLDLPNIPKDEYFELLDGLFEVSRTTEKKRKSIREYCKYINEHGENQAKKKSSYKYNECVKFTEDLGVSVLYTQFEHPTWLVSPIVTEKLEKSFTIENFQKEWCY